MVVLVFRAIDYLYHTGNLFLHVISAFFCRVSKSESSLTKYFPLSVTISSSRRIVHIHNLFMYAEFRQLIASIRITEVGRLG